MRRKNAWIAASVATALVLLTLGLFVPGLVSMAAPASAPIVLSFHETPIFLGPHEHWVLAIAFSPDGATVASGSGDGFLRLWDAGSGRLKSMHADDASRGLNGLTYSPDGRQIAAVGGLFGKEALIWDTASGQIARAIEEPDVANATMIYKGKPINFQPRTAVAFSPDGRLLATVADDVVLRDAQSGSEVAKLKHPSKSVKALAFSPDGKTLVTAATDRKVRIWSVPEGALQATLSGLTQPPVAVAISPDGKRIVAASSGGRSLLIRDSNPIAYLWAWDQPSGSPRKIEIADADVHQVAFVAPTTVVAAAGKDLLAVDLAGDDSQRPSKLWSQSNEILALAVSPDRRLVASGGRDRTVDIVTVATGKLVHRLPGLTDVVSSVATSGDGKRFAVASMDLHFCNRLPIEENSFAARYRMYFTPEANAGRLQSSTVRIWSSDDGRMETLLNLPPCQVTAVKFIPGTSQLAVAGWIPGKSGLLSLFDAADGKPIREFSVGTSEVLSIAVSPDGRTLASGDAEGNLQLWDVPSAAKGKSYKHSHPVEAVAFSHDGKLLATGDTNRTARILDPASGAVVRTLKSRSKIESLDFSPDANQLAAGTRDPGLELWDLRSDAASRTLAAPGDHFPNMPGFVAFSPDGQYVVCGGKGKDIAVFEAATGNLKCELRGHVHAATAVAFLPDGRLVSGGEERTVRLWDLELGKYLATWNAVPADSQQNWQDEWVGFTPAGKFVGSTSLQRLVGWQTGGEVILGAEDTDRRQRVESLFQLDSSAPSARK